MSDRQAAEHVDLFGCGNSNSSSAQRGSSRRSEASCAASVFPSLVRTANSGEMIDSGIKRANIPCITLAGKLLRLRHPAIIHHQVEVGRTDVHIGGGGGAVDKPGREGPW